MLAERYVVQSPISRGAMGTVHRALDRVTGTEVAIKRLTDITQVRRFEIEARLLSFLSHPRVVRVIDHFNDPTGYFLVMDLVRGADLGEVLKAGGKPGLPVDVVLAYAFQACEALDYVHQQRIVHRDVKPENLILGEDGVILVDFGVARQLDSEGPEDVGTVGVGTPRYMAPEIFAGGAVSERSDVFSLAATISTLLCGELPRYGDRRSLCDRVPEVTPELSDALRAGMEFMPERRIASINAFAKAIGRPLRGRAGSSFVRIVHTDEPEVTAERSLIGAVVRTAAGIFDAAAASIAIVDERTRELVYKAAWGAGGDEIVGVRLAPGAGLAGSVVSTGEPVLVADCRAAPRFARRIAANTGYVPNTMLIVPLKRDGETLGVLSLLDRRDGDAYSSDDVTRAALFADLALEALALAPQPA
ncbi:MAG: eukaryotic-like serine/threonine-protein kinase [Solirubrobacteraceae bacterium]|nr:eukaryotic-like serine/threonine-protein kinase [Solirubrobacteraceae bacterium]